MRVMAYTGTGPSNVLFSADRPVPEPGPGQVRVRLLRAGVNPTDWKMRSGTSAASPVGEIVPGQDGAGVVDAVGDGVNRAIGERVWLYLAGYNGTNGTAADYTVVPAHHAVPLPDNASFDVGASLGVPAMTAHRALTSGSVTRLAPGTLDGKAVLVHGGAGAVGNAAIQLARWAGATVATTVSSDAKAALARSAGAQHIVNYRTSDAADAIRAAVPDGVDLVVDVAPAVNAELDRRVTKQGAVIAIYANNGGNALSLPVRETFSLNLRYQFIFLYTVSSELKADAVADISAAVSDGALTTGDAAGLPLVHFPLADIAAAHDAVEGGAVGKVLLDID